MAWLPCMWIGEWTATLRRAGVPGTPHSLRHWYETNLVATGSDLRTAQTLLRHTNLQTTAIYVQVADEKRGEAIDRLDHSEPICADSRLTYCSARHHPLPDDGPNYVGLPDV